MTDPINLPTVHKINNPYSQNKSENGGNSLAHSQGSAVMAAEIQGKIAEVQASYLVAQSRPRNQVMAVDRMLTECQRPSLAEQAVYTFPRGGIEVTGPTIRLAEMIARNWGNVKCGWRCLDRKPGRSLIQAFAVDLETNFMDDIIFEVAHVRDTKTKGKVALTDERDIYEMEANQAARRLRKCILTIIPVDIIDSCLEQCEITLSSTSSNSPESIQKLLNAFKSYGVNKAMIEARLQRKLESITQAQVAQFKKIYASLKDSMSSAADWFDMSLADKEPKDIAENAKGDQEPKKRGRKPKEDSPAQTKAQENKASDMQEFNQQYQNEDEPEEATEAENNPDMSTEEEKPKISCKKCDDKGLIVEYDEETGEEIKYPCSGCSHQRQ